MDIFTAFVFLGICTAALMVFSILVRTWCFRSRVIAAFIADMGYLLFFIYLLPTQKIFYLPWIFFTQIPMALLLGPLAYFYVQIVLDEKKGLDRLDWLHFVPSVASVLVLVPFFMSSPDAMREIIYEALIKGGNLPLRMAMVSVVCVLTVYLIVLIKNVWRRSRAENRVQNLLMAINVLLFLGLIKSVTGIAGILAHSLPLLKFSCTFIVFIILIMFALTQRFPYLLLFGTIPGNGNAARRQIMGTEETALMERQLKLLMEEERFYADEDLSLTRLSGALEVTPHALSRFLNDHYSMNFNSYVNRYRVRDAMKMLVDEPQRNTLSIAYSSGFNSYTAFYTAFRKETGMSPAEYRSKKP